MSVTLRHCGLPGKVTRWQLLSAFEATAKLRYGLSRTAVAVFRHCIFRTFDQDYLCDRICAAWPAVCQVADALGLSPRSINSAERELVAAGFVARSSSINGARAGQRKNDVICWAAGINLAPAISRYEELRANAAAILVQHDAIRQCRAEIRNVNRTIRESEDVALRARSDKYCPAVEPHGSGKSRAFVRSLPLWRQP